MAHIWNTTLYWQFAHPPFNGPSRLVLNNQHIPVHDNLYRPIGLTQKQQDVFHKSKLNGQQWMQIVKWFHHCSCNIKNKIMEIKCTDKYTSLKKYIEKNLLLYQSKLKKMHLSHTCTVQRWWWWCILGVVASFVCVWWHGWLHFDCHSLFISFSGWNTTIVIFRYWQKLLNY